MHDLKTQLKPREPAPPDYRMRRRVLLAGLALALVAVLGRAFYQQILETEFLQVEGERRYLRELEIPAHRGEIRDRHGEPLAISAPVVTVWADPRRLPPDAAVLAPLAGVLNMKLDTLRRHLAKYSEKGFVYLKRGVSLEAGNSVRTLMNKYKAAGIGMKREYRRY